MDGLTAKSYMGLQSAATKNWVFNPGIRLSQFLLDPFEPLSQIGGNCELASCCHDNAPTELCVGNNRQRKGSGERQLFHELFPESQGTFREHSGNIHVSRLRCRASP